MFTIKIFYDLISDPVCQPFSVRIRDSASEESSGDCTHIRHTQGSLELVRFTAIGANELVYEAVARKRHRQYSV